MKRFGGYGFRTREGLSLHSGGHLIYALDAVGFQVGFSGNFAPIILIIVL